MIEEAHVGIGIMGAESNQAAQFSDFAVGEFKHIRRLMFWHGRGQGGKTSSLLLIKLLWSLIWVFCAITYQTGGAMSGSDDLRKKMQAKFWLGLTFIINFNEHLTYWALTSNDID